MKLVVVEPLGIEKEKVMQLAENAAKENCEIVYYDTRTENTAELIERAKDADIVVLANLPFRKDVIEQCKNLKLISVAFTGIDHIDMDYCKQNNLMVCNCAGYSTIAVSELVFGMAISLYRNIIACDSATRKEGTKNELVGLELCGKKFGVIGTGAIGMRVANIAHAFGCEVLAYSRTVKENQLVKYVDLDTLLSECDIVSLHVPLNEKTKGLINKEKLSKMKKTAVLINTARGPVVDSEALAEALNNDIIAGAAIDVFEKEPPIDASHPLLKAKNVLVTPHVAFATKEALEKRAEIVFDNVAKFLEGKPQNIM